MSKKIIIKTIICLLFISFSVSLVSAKSEYGNITVYSHLNLDDEKVIIQDKFELYKIANYIQDEYINVDNFKNFTFDYNNASSFDIDNYINKLCDYIKENNISKDMEAKSNSDGYAYFHNLDKGLYLILQSDKDFKYKTNPVLITVPLMVDEDTIYNIDLDLKYQDQEDIKPDVDTDDNDISYNQPPLTSDDTNLNIYTSISILSLFMMIISYMIYRRTK